MPDHRKRDQGYRVRDWSDHVRNSGRKRAKAKCVALSGPTFAVEVARDIRPPSCGKPGFRCCEPGAEAFSSGHLSGYTSLDVLGWNSAGAQERHRHCGGCERWTGVGENSKAALVTRAVVEIRRLGLLAERKGHLHRVERAGGFDGDLLLAAEPEPRFRREVGRGEQPAAISASMLAVAEDIRRAIGLAVGAQAPGSHAVIDEVYAMLYEGRTPAEPYGISWHGI